MTFKSRDGVEVHLRQAQDSQRVDSRSPNKKSRREELSAKQAERDRLKQRRDSHGSLPEQGSQRKRRDSYDGLQERWAASDSDDDMQNLPAVQSAFALADAPRSAFALQDAPRREINTPRTPPRSDPLEKLQHDIDDMMKSTFVRRLLDLPLDSLTKSEDADLRKFLPAIELVNKLKATPRNMTEKEVTHLLLTIEWVQKMDEIDGDIRRRKAFESSPPQRNPPRNPFESSSPHRARQFSPPPRRDDRNSRSNGLDER